MSGEVGYLPVLTHTSTNLCLRMICKKMQQRTKVKESFFEPETADRIFILRLIENHQETNIFKLATGQARLEAILVQRLEE